MITPRKPEPADDSDFDPVALDEAVDDRVTSDEPPEAPAGLEGITEWDTPLDAAGVGAPIYRLDDETTVGDALVHEGLDEADREQRIAAAEDEDE